MTTDADHSGKVVLLRADATDEALRQVGFERDALGGWRMAAPCEVILERTPGGTWQMDVVTTNGSAGVESDHIEIRGTN